MSEPIVLRRPRRSVIVVVGATRRSDGAAVALEKLLRELGIETIYLGREEDPGRIAGVVAEQSADAVEVCMAGEGCVRMLRELLRELIEIERGDVSIVPHRLP